MQKMKAIYRPESRKRYKRVRGADQKKSGHFQFMRSRSEGPFL